MVILKFNVGTQIYELIHRFTISSYPYGCSLSNDKKFLIVTESLKTTLFSFHEEGGVVTLN